MADRPSLIQRLREADLELQKEQISPAVDRRLQRLMAGEEPPPIRRSPARVWVPVAVGAVVLLAVLGLWLRQRPPQTPSPGKSLGGFRLASGDAHLESRDHVRCNTPRCALKVSELETRLNLKAKTVMRRRGGQIELVRGEVVCDVKPRPAKSGRTVKVFVSHGIIEVMGTRFTLRQQTGDGDVTLHRGAIRFVSNDGRTVALRPGEKLSWPLPAPEPESQPTTSPVTPDPDPPPATPKKPRPRRLDDREMRALLEQLERLRSQQRYVKAAQLLRRNLPLIGDRTTRERLSYELGSILTNQLGDKAQACRHWKRHLRRFGPARYGTEITKARKMLACSGD